MENIIAEQTKIKKAKEKEILISEDYEMYVGFILGQEEYGIDIKLIKEIIRQTEITSVPNVQEFIIGVINLRGEIVPLIDLRKRFKMKEIERDKNMRIIVVEVNGKLVGLLVDRITEVVKITKNQISPPPQMTSSALKEYITGVAKLPNRIVLLIDIARIIKLIKN
ncbi:MAG TPA: chemotaxis protein CheW [bacterium]|nr:chemotaxis protein CheW [bacterium]HOL47407.1 chemotaxis protein CheW [bacterium]HPQ18566.1 chemotaxis protein CheW [bacterium]